MLPSPSPNIVPILEKSFEYRLLLTAAPLHLSHPEGGWCNGNGQMAETMSLFPESHIFPPTVDNAPSEALQNILSNTSPLDLRNITSPGSLGLDPGADNSMSLPLFIFTNPSISPPSDENAPISSGVKLFLSHSITHGFQSPFAFLRKNTPSDPNETNTCVAAFSSHS